ncbi:DUF2971 domain-containing protein [Comamonas sp. HJ-2]
MKWITEFNEYLYPLDRKHLKIEQAFQLKHSNLPDYIYKHRSVNDNSLKNLREDTIWMADPKTLNDPYECHHYIDHQRMMDHQMRSKKEEIISMIPPERIPDFERALESSGDLMDSLVDVICSDQTADTRLKLKIQLKSQREKDFEEMSLCGDHIKDSIQLCSFTTRVDSTLMWSHYSDYHKGFCIKYDIKTLDRNDPRSRFLFPVIYQDQVFDATDNMQLAKTEKFNNLFLNRAALIKASDWSYENEWRIVFTNGILDKAQTLKMPTPTAVYLGSHISSDHEKVIKDICNEKKIEIFKMQHSRSRFLMTPNSVN